MTVAATNQRRRVRVGSTQNGGFDSNQRLLRNPPREAAAMGGMVRRVLAALRRRAASGDLEALVALRDLGVAVKVETRLAALALHDQAGYSAPEIALRLGVTRQAVEKWMAG